MEETQLAGYTYFTQLAGYMYFTQWK